MQSRSAGLSKRFQVIARRSNETERGQGSCAAMARRRMSAHRRISRDSSRPCWLGAAQLTGGVVLAPDGRVELANGVAQRLFRQPTIGVRHSFLSAVHIVAAQLERTLTDPDGASVPALTVMDEAHG